MERAGNFVIGTLTGMVGLFFLMHFTILRAHDGFHIVSKIAPRLEIPFEDIREYDLAKWQRKQPLALSIIKARKGHLFRDPSLLTFRAHVQSVLNKVQSSSKL
ncbi:MAG: hypothetical protein ACK5PB_03120 [Pirellula sp.]|jgi:hypothetical protein